MQRPSDNLWSGAHFPSCPNWLSRRDQTYLLWQDTPSSNLKITPTKTPTQDTKQLSAPFEDTYLGHEASSLPLSEACSDYWQQWFPPSHLSHVTFPERWIAPATDAVPMEAIFSLCCLSRLPHTLPICEAQQALGCERICAHTTFPLLSKTR